MVANNEQNGQQDAPKSPTKPTKSLSPAVNRASSILSELAASTEALGITHLARSLGFPKSSVGNILSALEEERLVERDQGGYVLGPRLIELGGAYLSRIDRVGRFYPACTRLPGASAETLLLARLDGKEVIYLARYDGSQPIRLASDVGKRMPAHVTALGQAMLATLNPDELDSVLSTITEYPRLTANSFDNESELRAALDETRARGFAIDDELNTAGVQCFARALPRDSATAVPHAVSCTILKARSTDELTNMITTDLGTLVSELP